MGDSDDDFTFLENGQPLFTEVHDEYSDNSRDTTHSTDEVYDMSPSLLMPIKNLYKRKRLQENDDLDVQEKDNMDNCDGNHEEIPDKCEQETQDLFEKVYEKHSDDEIPLQNNSEVQCVYCTFEKELDKRNYYFGNLLIEELERLPPCARSDAYINMLKYVDSLKHKHTDKPSPNKRKK